MIRLGEVPPAPPPPPSASRGYVLVPTADVERFVTQALGIGLAGAAVGLVVGVSIGLLVRR